MQKLGPMPSPSSRTASRMGGYVHWLVLTNRKDEYRLATIVVSAREAVGQDDRNSALGGRPHFRMARLFYRKVPRMGCCSCPIAWTFLHHGRDHGVAILCEHQGNNDSVWIIVGFRQQRLPRPKTLAWAPVLTEAERTSLVLRWP